MPPFHSSMRAARATGALVVLLGTLMPALSCMSPTDPLLDIRVELTAHPNHFGNASMVRFVAAAHNPTKRSIQIGMCGPPLDVYVRTGGTWKSVLTRVYGPDLECSPRPEHVVQPGQKHVLNVVFPYMPGPGTYEAVAQLRHRMQVTSPTITFTVE